MKGSLRDAFQRDISVCVQGMDSPVDFACVSCKVVECHGLVIILHVVICVCICCVGFCHIKHVV